MSVKTSVIAWLKSEAGQRTGKRMAFTFLTLWVHGATLFFFTMILFAGKKTADKNQVSVAPPPAIEVLLNSPPPETPPDQPQVTSTPDDTGAPLISEKSLPLAKPEEITPKDGILDCESLNKRPQRIVLGPNSPTYGPDEDQSGHVEMHLTINHDGTVIGVRIEKSTMTPTMTQKIVAFAATSIFRPGEIGGVAVDCDMKYDISVTPPAGLSNKVIETR